MNVVAFVGKVKEMPVLKESNAGNKFATMIMEVNRNFQNSDGTLDTDKISVTLWKGIAEITINTCRPGDWISVKGRLQAHEYEGRDGMMRSAYDIIAEHVSILQ